MRLWYDGEDMMERIWSFFKKKKKNLPCPAYHTLELEPQVYEGHGDTSHLPRCLSTET